VGVQEPPRRLQDRGAVNLTDSPSSANGFIGAIGNHADATHEFSIVISAVKSKFRRCKTSKESQVAICGEDLTVLSDKLTVSGATQFGNTVAMDDKLVVAGDATFASDAQFGGKVMIDGKDIVKLYDDLNKKFHKLSKKFSKMSKELNYGGGSSNSKKNSYGGDSSDSKKNSYASFALLPGDRNNHYSKASYGH